MYAFVLHVINFSPHRRLFRRLESGYIYKRWFKLNDLCFAWQSSGAPPSAFQVPYNSFKQKVSSVKDGGHEVKSTILLEEIKSKDLDYDFLCFFLSTPRLDLYRSIDFRCEDMLLGKECLCDFTFILLWATLENCCSCQIKQLRHANIDILLKKNIVYFLKYDIITIEIVKVN